MKNHDHDDGPRLPFGAGYADSYIKLSKHRKIFVSEDITKKSAAEISALLLYYDNGEDQSPIQMYINSNGGDASGLANIYDVMQMINSPIETICIGKAYSAGAVILAAGAKGTRYALRNSKIMIHGIQFAFPIPGEDIVNSKNYLDFLNNNNDNIMKMLAAHTGHPLDKLKDDCKQDYYMDANQALEYGIVDKVI